MTPGPGLCFGESPRLVKTPVGVFFFALLFFFLIPFSIFHHLSFSFSSLCFFFVLIFLSPFPFALLSSSLKFWRWLDQQG